MPKFNRIALLSTLEAMYSNVLMAYTVFVVYMQLPLFRDYVLGTENAALYDLIFVGLCSIGILFYYRSIGDFLRHPATKWVIAVLCVFVISHVLILNSDKLFDDEEIWYDRNRIERFMLLPIIGFILYNTKRSIVYRYLKIVAFVIPALIILDFAVIGLMDPENNVRWSGRAEGTFVNANLAGEAALVTMLLVIKRLPRLFALSLYAIVGVAVFVTFSRAAMMFFVLSGIYFIFKNTLPRYTLILFAALAVFYGTAIAYVEDALLEKFPDNPAFVLNMVDRLSIFQISSADLDDQSAEGREEKLRDGIKGFLDEPWLGQRYSDANSHNMIVDWAYTFGIVGVVLWAWLLWLLAFYGSEWRKFSLKSLIVVAYFWFSFFTHNLLETFFWHFAFALLLYRQLRDYEAIPSNPPRKISRRRKRKALRWA